MLGFTLSVKNFLVSLQLTGWLLVTNSFGWCKQLADEQCTMQENRGYSLVFLSFLFELAVAQALVTRKT